MKRIIAINSNTYHGFSIEEAIAGIADAGFHYIELTCTKGWTEHVYPDQPILCRVLRAGNPALWVRNPVCHPGHR